MSIQYPIIESFTSIQGEGMHMGKGATFIRVAGCNLRCRWCDTSYSFDPSKARLMSAQEIVDEIPMPHQHIVITGGEPTLYDLGPLVYELHKLGKYVAIETNGTNPIPVEWGIDWVTASPKPGSGFALACSADELKYVVDDEFSIEYITDHEMIEGRIFLQVESGRPESAQKAYDLIQRFPERRLRLGIQLHKFLNVR
ncbi:7-carboxy-7-deazaguanine synthase QueE [Desulfitobacterium metallireducens]|uniref:7-carboxy-7-deazaguanine synthase n=1 Tax=Desulfitobacterium metallireducens DSM 15288 TaxID=871968 RepID=W0EG76_9FIRM|nr:7-carboxy-7-deazaguanine synthase QueE [Desulfitobacterium metallireducens]AHF08179.1 radical SAM protein [Desulfitobacterium metallireducens DSM 15288]